MSFDDPIALGDRLLDDFMGSGWTRFLPNTVLPLTLAVIHLHIEDATGELADLPLDSESYELIGSIGGLDAGVWEPFEEDLARHPDEAEHVEAQRERLARVAAVVGMTVETNADLVELMRTLGIFERVDDDEVRWRIGQPLPLPDERIPMTADERAREDGLRWRQVHERNAQAVIRLFVNDELDAITESLQGFGERLEMPPESVREAIANLLEAGDFSTAVDVSRIAVDESFELAIDWDAFAEKRIEIRLASPGDD